MSSSRRGRIGRAVSADAIRTLFHSIGNYGATGDGGCDRPAFSEQERSARAALFRHATERGYTAFRDEIGSVFVIRPGTDSSSNERAVYTGSHLDSVPAGGCFDGASGVLCGLAALELFDAARISTRRPLALVSWANEEGARFSPATMGSGVFTGTLPLDSALASRDVDGVELGNELAHETIPVSVPPPAAAYIELHPEQGRLLERAGVPLGVVEGVQGQVSGDWTITGRADHAGTTPMDDRSDALLAAAALVNSAAETASRRPPGVATVGQIRVHPGARNVVPGFASGTLDIRHPDDGEVAGMLADIRRQSDRLVREYDCVFEWRDAWTSKAVAFDSRVIQAIEDACRTRHHPSIRLSSGAGHDAVHLSAVCPSGMIFVP
ncbi:MAG: hydantoinase/carbamoylase family amidase, partial [Spirochaetes bacterium]|nr:hydantoinase/carbamoylase family amidase [Spirochaetota bacterium]